MILRVCVCVCVCGGGGVGLQLTEQSSQESNQSLDQSINQSINEVFNCHLWMCTTSLIDKVTPSTFFSCLRSVFLLWIVHLVLCVARHRGRWEDLVACEITVGVAAT